MQCRGGLAHSDFALDLIDYLAVVEHRLIILARVRSEVQAEGQGSGVYLDP